MVGTTDDPCSSLSWHEKLAEDPACSVLVCPSFRPDPAFKLQKPGFAAYVEQLEEASGQEISTVEDMRRALSARMAWFHRHGCRAADHGLDRLVYRPVSDEAATAALQRARAGQPVGQEEAEGWQTALLLHCAEEYARLDGTDYASRVIMQADGSALVIGGSLAFRFLP